jgi:hypothetical protein
MKSTCKKKVLQRNSTFGKNYFKNLVRSLRGWKYTSKYLHHLGTPSQKLHPSLRDIVTNRMAVYLEMMVRTKRRSRDAGGLSEAMARARSGMPSPLSIPTSQD